MRNHQRALFIRFGGLGDILLATPSVRALAAAFPGIEIDFLVGGNMAEAIEGHPNIRRVIVFNKRGVDSRLDHFLPFLWRLSKERYDLVVNLHPSAKTFLMSWASLARTVIIFRKNLAVDKPSGGMIHAIDDFAKELKHLGISSVPDRGLDFFIPAAAHRNVEKVLREAGVNADDLVLTLNPAASQPVNRWSVKNFCELAAHFAGISGVKVVVTGAPSSVASIVDSLDETALAREVALADPRIINLAGGLTVKELAALLQRSSAFLTSDTGPMHIASALNTPMVALFGAADPTRTGPLSGNAIVLADQDLSCLPCRSRKCFRGDVMCMQSLSVERVSAALKTAMRITERKAHKVELPIVP